MRSILRVGQRSNETRPAIAQKQKAFRKGINFSMALFSILLMGLMTPSQQAFAQFTGAPAPCPNCTAEDIKITKPFLVLNGTPAPTCPTFGDALSGQIKLALDVTAKQRYGLAVVAELWVNDAPVRVIDTCYRRVFSQGPDTVVFATLVNFNAGQKVELRNVMTAWDNQKPSTKYPNYAKPCDAILKTGGVVTGYDCKVLTDIQGISLTPKCKYYQLLGVETPAVKPDITLDNKTNILCNGNSTGSINISVSPASQSPYSYTYSWTGPNSFSSTSQDISGLKAGTYYVTVTVTPGCSNTANWTLTEPTALGGSAVTTPVSCNGGSNGTATVTPTGGTGPYSYSWSPSGGSAATATGLSAGTYSCLITDANNCTFNVTNIVVSQPGTLSASITAQTNVTCNGGDDGSATVTGSGGTTPYSYSWNTTPPQTTQTATGLTAGVYVATITDNNGCTATANDTITEPTAITVSAAAAEGTICEGSTTTVTVTASGGTGTLQYKLDGGSYQASNSFTNVGVGAHTVTVKDDNGCTNTDDVTINGKECNRFCTYTQGYFGNEGGKSSYDTGAGCQQQQSTRTAIQTAINWWSSRGGLKIGNITVTSVDAILNYLPGGGPSENYGGSTLSGAAPNTLLAQTLTLGLNIGLNQYLGGYNFEGHIFAQKTDGSCGQGNVTSGCKSYSFGAPYDTMTVREIFEAAGKALKEGNAAERTTLAGIAGAINESFDECAKAVPSCPAITGTKAANRLSGETQENALIPDNLLVKAYPNPFTNQVFLNFTAPVSGTAVIEFFDLSGRRLEVMQRNLVAGQETLINFNTAKAGKSNLIYKVTLGAFTQNGKLFYTGKH